MPFAQPDDIPGGANGYHNTTLACANVFMIPHIATPTPWRGAKCYARPNCKLVTCMPFAGPHDIPGGTSGYPNTALTCADGTMPARSDRDRMSQR